MNTAKNTPSVAIPFVLFVAACGAFAWSEERPLATFIGSILVGGLIFLPLLAVWRGFPVAARAITMLLFAAIVAGGYWMAEESKNKKLAERRAQRERMETLQLVGTAYWLSLTPQQRLQAENERLRSENEEMRRQQSIRPP